MVEPITQNQANFLKDLVKRVEISKLNEWEAQFISNLTPKIEEISKNNAKVAISFILYLESTTKNGCFCDALGILEKIY